MFGFGLQKLLTTLFDFFRKFKNEKMILIKMILIKSLKIKKFRKVEKKWEGRCKSCGQFWAEPSTSEELSWLAKSETEVLLFLRVFYEELGGILILPNPMFFVLSFWLFVCCLSFFFDFWTWFLSFFESARRVSKQLLGCRSRLNSLPSWLFFCFGDLTTLDNNMWVKKRES